MSSTTSHAVLDTNAYRDSAAKHLWRHFALMADAEHTPLKIMVRGEGCYLVDSEGNRYLDGLSNLFCVNVGYSFGDEFAEAAAEQYRQLGYHSNWGSTHPRAIELAAKIASLAPQGLDHVFLTPTGGEAVEAAWKIARQYHKLRGQTRWKAIARDRAYHGTTLGALSLGGIAEIRSPFEPLLPQVAHIRNTNRVSRPEGESDEQFTAFLLDDLEQRILSEDPATIAMVIMEPVQNRGGMLTPPRGYAAGVRSLCDKYGILLVADETITAFGRLGAWFASERYEMRPDIVTTAKGLSSAHAVIGATVVRDEIYGVFTRENSMLTHGNTFGGHPVMAAVALRNIEILQRLNLPEHVLAHEQELSDKLSSLLDLPIVCDLRGAGFFYAMELTGSKPDGTPLTDLDKTRLYRKELLVDALEQRGLILRVAPDGAGPVLCIAPPLIAGSEEFDVLINVLHDVLSDLSERLLTL